MSVEVRMPSKDQLEHMREQLILRLNGSIGAVTVHPELLLALVIKALGEKPTG